MIYNKLVRDRIPEIIASEGKRYRVRTLDTEEFVARLREKLDEEIAEYRRAETSAEAIEELADILEVIYHLAAVHGSTVEELEAVRIRKRVKRGGFEKRLFLVEADE
ncbi:MAG: nucleoside triphosphate pyrophosphohydrolase [Sulfobacillus sp.]|nr:nucleoside triphosphate pyrophosphohydrolase [Sulfobacillus sp.]